VLALVGCTSIGTTTAGTSAAPITTTPITNTGKVKFAYTGNQGASLSGFSVNTPTGALTALTGFPFTIGANPSVVAADPQNRFLFVGDVALSELHFSPSTTRPAR